MPNLVTTFFITCLAIILPASLAAGEPVVRVGILEFGTVNWELDVIKHHQLDRQNGFKLEVAGFGSKSATAVALQSAATRSPLLRIEDTMAASNCLSAPTTPLQLMCLNH